MEEAKVTKKITILLIALMVIGVGFLSGCTEVGIGLTNIGNINANPEEYLGKEVTVEGACGSHFITDDGGHTIPYIYSNMLTGRYRLTGIVRNGTGVYYGVYVIEVTKAKAL